MQKNNNQETNENSYYYWCQSQEKKSAPLNLNSKPKKISLEESSLSESQVKKNQSKWNSIGTWENKHFKVEDFVKFSEEHPGSG